MGPACAKGGAAFLKPLYDSIIQRYAQLEKVPESALVLLIKKAAACEKPRLNGLRLDAQID